MSRKVTACGSAVRIDFGSGFVTVGLCDSITPFGQTKTVNETPDLSCESDAQVGREEQSTMEFGHYWDPQDADHSLIEQNFDDSKDDLELRDLPVQLVSPEYVTDSVGAVKSQVTWEATAQIVSVVPDALEPDNYYKRRVTLVRRGPITKTVAPV